MENNNLIPEQESAVIENDTCASFCKAIFKKPPAMQVDNNRFSLQ